MRYYYLRVSTIRQSFQDQINKLQLVDLEILEHKAFNNGKLWFIRCKDCIIIQEVSTGFNFNRKGYLNLFDMLKNGDELYISDVTRLGRVFHFTIYEIIEIENKIGKPIHFEDVERDVGRYYDYSNYYEYRQTRDKYILEKLLYEEEKEERKRQLSREAIRNMPKKNGKRYSNKTGRYLGRPSIETKPLYSKFKELYILKLQHQIAGKEIRKVLNMSDSQYKKYRARFNKELKPNRKYADLDDLYVFR